MSEQVKCIVKWKLEDGSGVPKVKQLDAQSKANFIAMAVATACNNLGVGVDVAKMVVDDMARRADDRFNHGLVERLSRIEQFLSGGEPQPDVTPAGLIVPMGARE